MIESPDENREALAQYLRQAGKFNPAADGNWRILPVPGVKMQFTSAAAAIRHLPRVPAVQLVQDQGDGWAIYELKP